MPINTSKIWGIFILSSLFIGQVQAVEVYDFLSTTFGKAYGSDDHFSGTFPNEVNVNKDLGFWGFMRINPADYQSPPEGMVRVWSLQDKSACFNVEKLQKVGKNLCVNITQKGDRPYLGAFTDIIQVYSYLGALLASYFRPFWSPFRAPPSPGVNAELDFLIKVVERISQYKTSTPDVLQHSHIPTELKLPRELTEIIKAKFDEATAFRVGKDKQKINSILKFAKYIRKTHPSSQNPREGWSNPEIYGGILNNALILVYEPSRKIEPEDPQEPARDTANRGWGKRGWGKRGGGWGQQDVNPRPAPIEQHSEILVIKLDQHELESIAESINPIEK